MPFFGPNSERSPRSRQPELQAEEAPKRTGSIFSRRSAAANLPSDTMPVSHNEDTQSTRSGGFFSFRNRNSSDSSGEFSSAVSRDPTITAALQKVRDAENAERMADQALAAARASVREARDHVRILEREAIEEARRAKYKQEEAKHVSKSARSLGRHG
ncbi:hypothetical protein K488DRAFT_56277 [Vararia minispora EC-137]|uniref:Uncharacterized protein n=1 Tax=Vararia minispora EC-137 TaxID=1314806 RepID=A0ACB8QCD7_9AGAM|nr:hypothetical protein K488DRAFT_56277 [Vararia minispora EC-137]